MFGIGANGFVDGFAKYYFAGSWKILLISAVASFPFVSQQGNNLLKGTSKIPVYLSVVWFGVLLLLCIAGMMSSTYSSFLYFQF
jgi:alginate O-acetyltransferase complex protein AlgI